MAESTRRGAEIAYNWWWRLAGQDGAAGGGRRAALARLRRAPTPLAVMQEPEALRLIERLPHSRQRAAILAGVLALVRESEKQTVARKIGRKSLDDDKSALVSEGRFRRLLQAHDDELMESMRRLVRMTKGKINVLDLSNAILYWGDRVKKRWIFDYYGVASSLNSQDDAPESSTTSGNQQ